MQDNAQLGRLVMQLIEYGCTFDIFTNGSFVFPDWVSRPEVRLVMDFKLPGSGEEQTAIDIRLHNASRLRAKDAIKFVVKDMDDFTTAIQWSRDLVLANCEIYVGRVWEGISDNDLVELIKEHRLPWRLNVQLHKYLWPNIERGI